MPTYEYECRRCDERVEVFQRISDQPLTECPKCSGPLRRVFHPVGVVFKGSGFYTTDYARKKAATAGSAAGSNGEGEKGKSTEGDGGGSSEKAPAGAPHGDPPSTSSPTKADGKEASTDGAKSGKPSPT